MTTTTIKKPKTLSDQLKLVPVGTTLFVSERDYRTTTVRKACSALNRKGYYYVPSEMGVFGGINVTRNK
ncbi:MAG: hypothetical protein RR854_00415 [Muribaculaceae bacterium]